VQAEEFTVDNLLGNDYTIGGGGVIGGPTGLTKTGAGRLVMRGENTFLGTSLSDTELSRLKRLAIPPHRGRLGKAVASPSVITAGASDAVLVFTGGTATNGREVVVEATGGTIQITQATTTLTLTNNLSGPGAFTKSGAGTVAFTGTGGRVSPAR
jgi:fibronectin-binding autotransporter adhesin